MTSWITDWRTVQGLASGLNDVTLLHGRPQFLGYLTQHFNVYRGRSTSAFDEWETKIPNRIVRDLTDQLRQVDPLLVPAWRQNKLGAIPAFHSLAPLSQSHGVPIGGLRGIQGVNPGNYQKIDEADMLFRQLAGEIVARTKLKHVASA